MGTKKTKKTKKITNKQTRRDTEQNYLFFNYQSRRYKIIKLSNKAANEILRKLNSHRCGRHYMITGKKNIEIVEILLGDIWICDRKMKFTRDRVQEIAIENKWNIEGRPPRPQPSVPGQQLAPIPPLPPLQRQPQPQPQPAPAPALQLRHVPVQLPLLPASRSEAPQRNQEEHDADSSLC
jgi:hypothetical protein